MLHVLPGDETKTVVIPRDTQDLAGVIGCERVQLWPGDWQLDSIETPSGRHYRFNVWVDESGRMRAARVNRCATLAAHPLNEAMGHVIYGSAVLEPIDGASYTLDDWRQICQGVWYDERLVERNAAGRMAGAVRH